jgi:hypothetical protein
LSTNTANVSPMKLASAEISFTAAVFRDITWLHYLTLSWLAGHICPTYKMSFQVYRDTSNPLILHAAIYFELTLLRETSQNAFYRETTVYIRYCVQCCVGDCLFLCILADFECI